MKAITKSPGASELWVGKEKLVKIQQVVTDETKYND
jgi:hypothetical protein